MTHEEKQQRLQILQDRLNSNAAEIGRHMIGTVQRVLIERPSKKDSRQVAGRTENMRWVNFDAPHALIGQFADVLITESLTNSLRGRLVESDQGRHHSDHAREQLPQTSVA